MLIGYVDVNCLIGSDTTDIVSGSEFPLEI